jgi:hypothetical protein
MHARLPLRHLDVLIILLEYIEITFTRPAQNNMQARDYHDLSLVQASPKILILLSVSYRNSSLATQNYHTL